MRTVLSSSTSTANTSAETPFVLAALWRGVQPSYRKSDKQIFAIRIPKILRNHDEGILPYLMLSSRPHRPPVFLFHQHLAFLQLCEALTWHVTRGSALVYCSFKRKSVFSWLFSGFASLKKCVVRWEVKNELLILGPQKLVPIYTLALCETYWHGSRILWTLNRSRCVYRLVKCPVGNRGLIFFHSASS